MHKTTVEIDLDAFRTAEGNLGTRGFKETINTALVELNRRIALERGMVYLEERRDSMPAWEALRAWREVRI